MVRENVNKAEHVHSVFSQIAGRYDFMNSVLSFQQHRLWRRFAMRQLQIPAAGKVLDVAAGTGAWTFALAETVGEDGRVVGLDFCKEMLDVARVRQNEMKTPSDHVLFIEGNAMEMPFQDNEFDVATIGFALRNVPDVRQCLSEMMRVIKPGGTVVSLELSKPQIPVFRQMYYFYFQKILPYLGAMAVGSKTPYAWLPESLADFPDRIRLEGIFREVGLQRVRSYALTGGIAALHIGLKPEESTAP
ncbi:MAG: demethylmenaquinone methyltransferase [Alicyclobacillaceae bacterium]|uniref:demethylmenaquinone methyltransferase n=1 Tax=Alicyclobacillus sp. SP_1 TaxID=2942475 RepID=UPI0021589ADF|nr:demethylmenaquinone methyltransferase [Alicyclobacillus sp. SP_1]MCY0888555.1 demethylmenaquinone methyltransferase [Alicyclobacillaceae bacterium]